MHFKAVFPIGQISNGTLVYRPSEYSFDVVPRPNNFTSVLINDLNLELDEQGRVVSIWGLCPYTTWKTATLNPPNAEFGDVFILLGAPLERGISLRSNRDRWPIFVDKVSGWVRVDGGCSRVRAVKVMIGVILGVFLFRNVAVWHNSEVARCPS
jgi:hypothetical protein